MVHIWVKTSLRVVPLSIKTRSRLQSCEQVAGVWWRESTLFLRKSRELLFVRSLASVSKLLKLMACLCGEGDISPKE